MLALSTTRTAGDIEGGKTMGSNVILVAVSLLGGGSNLLDLATDADLAALCDVHTVAARGGTPERLIVHIRDWHFVAREDYATDLRDQNPKVTDDEIDEAYGKSIARSVGVQREQEAVLGHLIQRHGTRQVFLEGLTDRDRPIFDLIVGVLRRSERRESETWMRVGAAGHLLVDGKLERIVPAEHEDIHDAANPVRGGEIRFDEQVIRRRRKAIVERLERERIAVVVLGASHDLSPLVSDDTVYVQLTVPEITKLERDRE